MDDLNTVLENANIFYIHYHKTNIENKTLSQTFNEQKKIIAAQVKSQYVELFNASINSGESIKVLAAAMNLT